MLNLKSILKKNKITIKTLAKAIDISVDAMEGKLRKEIDFTIKELEQIYTFLVENKIIDNSIDIGDLLNEVD